MQVLVTGATGTLGRAVTTALTGRAHAVRVLTRNPDRAPDLVSVVVGSLADPTAVADAVDGVDAVVHCATDPRNHRDVDVAGTRRLIESATRAGSPHLVFPGIVGSDVIPLKYYRSKQAAEELLTESALPYSIVRATQFHSLVWFALERMARLPVVPLPRDTRFQPIDHLVVARRLVERAEEGATGAVESVGGPTAYPAIDLARSHKAATGHRRPLVQLNYPGLVGASWRAGGALTPHRDTEGRTWNDFVDARLAGGSSGGR